MKAHMRSITRGNVMDRKIDTIIIHCAATPNGKHFTVEDIDSWHRERGFARSYRAMRALNPSLTSIGYHFVIYIDGSVHTGRGVEEIGAHAAGMNAHSIGICLIGSDKFSDAQWDALHNLVNSLKATIGGEIKVVGHRDIPGVHKSCPGFDVASWLEKEKESEVA